MATVEENWHISGDSDIATGGYGGTVFPGGVRYSLVNNVCGVRYSLGYRIHSDTGLTKHCI